MEALGLASTQAYRQHLEERPEEWEVLDEFCRITISRFFRDLTVWSWLRDSALPDLATRARHLGRSVRCWSVGCASGEEPYSLILVWRLGVSRRFPDVSLEVLATDADAHMLNRAERACYPAASLREVPEAWTDLAFVPSGSEMCLREPFRTGIELRQGDVRASMPEGPFDLILCRNLAFTYFDLPVQRRVLEGLTDRLVEGGRLVLGSHERLPDGSWPLVPDDTTLPVHRRTGSVGGAIAAPITPEPNASRREEPARWT